MVMGVWPRTDLALPRLTKIFARGAKTVGAFGLVARWLTILYHDSILALLLPCATFTKHYHRGEGLTTDQDL